MPQPLESHADLASLTKEERLARMRHSAAHVLAEAMVDLLPEAELGIGPPTDTGFYYDFRLPRSLTEEDLGWIEDRMRQSIARSHDFRMASIERAEAEERWRDQPFKLDLLKDIEDGNITQCTHAEFTDLCRGGHVNDTGEIPAFKLMSIAGAYWRGDEKNPQLQRVYGALFETQEELDAYEQQLEEARRRDHRRIGRELDLFSTQEEYGPGLIYWHPKGARIRLELENLWREEHERAGYQLVYTPHIGRSTLWETSGHLDFYADGMYSPMDIDGSDYYLKPMNCPFHIQIYKDRGRSYRELPMRIGELGTVYRYERSGTLHGMLRVRGFTQDDAHIICTPDQLLDEIVDVVEFALRLLRLCGYAEFKAYLSTRPEEKYVGQVKDWGAAEESLRQALERTGIDYEVKPGEGAFYGPKIDLDLVDAVGRAWQLSTIQFDFNLPERFDMTYIGADGGEHRPFMVHRALFGSIERFVGILIEHFEGNFPLWLAPTQATVIPIADRHIDYAREVAAELRAAGLRVEIDERNERMNAKIRDAQLMKVPYMLVVGDREAEAKAAALRVRGGGDRGAMPVAEVVAQLRAERDAKAVAP